MSAAPGSNRLEPVAVESISAVTLATHDMARALRFYRALGFPLRYGDEAASFSSFSAGNACLNVILAEPACALAWWGRVISTCRTSTRCTGRRSPPG